MGKKIWSGISVFCPGNFVSVHVSKLKGNYVIVNKAELLSTFFDTVQSTPFSMPEIKAKPQFIGKRVEVQFERMTKKNEYKALGYREIKRTETKGTKHIIK